MKICFVLNMLSTGGAERVASRLCSEWSKDNEVIIILTSFTKIRDYDIPENIKIINLCENKRVSRLSIIKGIRKILKNADPDIVVSFLDTGHFYTAVAKKGLRVKHVCSERNDPYNVPTSKLIRWMRLYAFKRCDSIVFQTNGAKGFFNKKIQNKGRIIENPITSDFFDCDIGCSSNKIIAVGRLVEQKNYKLLIDSFSIFYSKHKEYSLSIYGRGPLENELTKYISSNGLSGCVKINGFCKNISSELKKAKIYAMTSLHEGMPNSLIEAICCGIPSISTNANPGGARAVINGYKGSIVVENNDPISFSRCLEMIHNNYGLFKRNASLDAKHARERFNIAHISKMWLDLFRELVDD